MRSWIVISIQHCAVHGTLKRSTAKETIPPRQIIPFCDPLLVFGSLLSSFLFVLPSSISACLFYLCLCALCDRWSHPCPFFPVPVTSIFICSDFVFRDQFYGNRSLWKLSPSMAIFQETTFLDENTRNWWLAYSEWLPLPFPRYVTWFLPLPSHHLWNWSDATCPRSSPTWHPNSHMTAVTLIAEPHNFTRSVILSQSDASSSSICDFRSSGKVFRVWSVLPSSTWTMLWYFRLASLVITRSVASGFSLQVNSAKFCCPVLRAFLIHYSAPLLIDNLVYVKPAVSF